MIELIVISCIWLIPVVVMTWMADALFDKDPRWVFLFGFLFGPIGALIALLLLPPRNTEEKRAEQDAKLAEERRAQAREAMERGPRQIVKPKKQKMPEPDRYEL